MLEEIGVTENWPPRCSEPVRERVVCATSEDLRALRLTPRDPKDAATSLRGH